MLPAVSSAEPRKATSRDSSGLLYIKTKEISMKYRVKHSITKERKYFSYGRLRAVRSYRKKTEEPIDFISLFEFAEQYDVPLLPVPRKKPSAFARLLFWIKNRFRSILARLKTFIAKKREKRLKRRETVYMLLGALCASILVTVVSVGVVLLSLFGRYGTPYTTVTVPNFVGTLYEDTESSEDGLFSYVIDYEYNPNVTPGHVISQSPPPGTQRRVYASSRYCLISLTVSHAKAAYTLDELIGLSARDASLILRNNGLVPKITNEYSSSVPCGTVIRMSPKANKIMSEGETVTLTVSLGPQVILCAVPSLTGLTEMQAITKIKSAGLVCGSITYVDSELSAGTVISQSIPSKSAVKENTPVDITVSIGTHTLKTIPSLYGKTVEDAREILRSYGLILGTQIPVESAEAKGTVISQNPLPNTPITSSTVSVDVYVSY
jgi:beta-lactam-binding protein with PASTA domain